MLEETLKKLDTFFDAAAAHTIVDSSKHLDVEQTRGVAKAYAIHYKDDGWSPVAVEKEYELPIIDLETKQPISGGKYTTHIGKIDAIVKDSRGKILLVDHKTASKVDANYFQELKTNSQVSEYFMSLWQMDIKVDEIVWDVIKKPSIKPKTVTKKAKEEYEEFGTYMGVKYPHKDFKGANTETNKMYGHRVFVTYLSKPQDYFIRRRVTRTPNQIKMHLEELAATAKRLNELTEETALRNVSGCSAYGRLCDYHPICCGEDPTKESFTAATKSPHTKSFSSNGLSDSTLKKARRCDKLHWLEKREKIVPSYKAYEKNLVIGDLFHKAIEMVLLERPAAEHELNFKGNLIK